ncbi:unnamed protein product, partial [Oppiella nova]
MHGVEYWNEPTRDLRPVLSLVGPEGNQFLRTLNTSHIRYEITANSFQEVIDGERRENYHHFSDAKNFDFETKYHTYSEIKSLLNELSEQSDKVTYKSVGKSYESRDIPAIVLTNPGGGAKQTIFLECGIHAREWVSTAACLYMINQLLTDSANDKYLEKYEFIIVPALNVDGPLTHSSYVYTWETDRKWRKTRSLDSRTGCYGTDPNRNWDTAWCEEGATTNPCSDQYCGPDPFSEVEVKQWSELVATRKGRIAAYFAFHSYSQYWMYPYGYKHALPANVNELEKLSAAAVKAIQATHSLQFKKGNIADDCISHAAQPAILTEATGATARSLRAQRLCITGRADQTGLRGGVGW